MASKSALVLGMCEYEDAKLARLHAPSSDVRALAKVLSDGALGGFEVVTEHLDEGRSLVERAITKLFADKQHDDLVLLYFSGHGLRDDGGDLYLAVKDTDHNDLDGTAVAADFIKRVMNKSNSRRQVLILDCCHSGAFSSGLKGGAVVGASVGTKAAFDPDGFGRIILTASDATQYAWEGEKVTGEAQTSLYTSFLIEGIRSGAADLSRDGMITVNELHEYVYKKTVESTSKQRPTKICDHEKGNLILSRAPLHTAALPEEVTSALRSPFPNIRQAMVANLVEMFRYQSPGTAISAYKALGAMAEDDSKTVREAVAEALRACQEMRPEIDPGLLGAIVMNAAGTVVETPGELLAMKKKQEKDAREAKRLLEEIAAKAKREEERAKAAEGSKAVFAGKVVPGVREAAGPGGQTALWEAVREKMDAAAAMAVQVRLGRMGATLLMQRKAEGRQESGGGSETAIVPERPGRASGWLQSRWKFGLIVTGTLMVLVVAVGLYSGSPGSYGSGAGPVTTPASAVANPASAAPDGAARDPAATKGQTVTGTLEMWVYDPVSNVRAKPTAKSAILCSIDSVQQIEVEPVSATAGWYRTKACGSTGYIAENQVSVSRTGGKN